MRADDVTETLELALVASGCGSAKVVHKPRLLSDNGSSYISSDLAEECLLGDNLLGIKRSTELRLLKKSMIGDGGDRRGPRRVAGEPALRCS